jgi:SepF-like predicted cell division protein (DUF552 family)
MRKKLSFSELKNETVYLVKNKQFGTEYKARYIDGKLVDKKMGSQYAPARTIGYLNFLEGDRENAISIARKFLNEQLPNVIALYEANVDGKNAQYEVYETKSMLDISQSYYQTEVMLADGQSLAVFTLDSKTLEGSQETFAVDTLWYIQVYEDDEVIITPNGAFTTLEE